MSDQHEISSWDFYKKLILGGIGALLFAALAKYLGWF